MCVCEQIGLLRDGQLLAEDSPDEILRKFDCDTLEDAFLKLALRQHEMPRRSSKLIFNFKNDLANTIKINCFEHLAHLANYLKQTQIF